MRKNSAMASRLALFGLLFLSACYQKREGCLDIRAVNYDVRADISCADCCTYPRLSIKLEHRAVLTDTILPFRYDSVYALASHPDVPFRFHRTRYYISEVRLEGSGNTGWVNDSITLYLPQGTDTIPLRVVNDFVLGDRNFLQAVQLGSWMGEGSFDRLTFTLGLEDAVRVTDPDKAPAGHVLRAPDDGVNWDEDRGYISNFMLFSAGARDSFPVAITEGVPVSLFLDPPLHIPPGYNVQLILYLNYLAWWEGLDLSTASPAEIEQAYYQQAGNAFYQIELTLN